MGIKMNLGTLNSNNAKLGHHLFKFIHRDRFGITNLFGVP